MLTLAGLNPKSLPLAEKTLRRLLDYYQKEGLDFKIPDISSMLGQNSVYLAKDSTKVYSIGIVSHDLLNFLFPVSRSEKDLVEIIEEAGFKNEETLLVSVYFDPGFSTKESKNAIFSYLNSNFPRCSWGSVVYDDDPIALNELTKRGFKFIARLKEVENASFYAKPYKKDGLASWDF